MTHQEFLIPAVMLFTTLVWLYVGGWKQIAWWLLRGFMTALDFAREICRLIVVVCGCGIVAGATDGRGFDPSVIPVIFAAIVVHKLIPRFIRWLDRSRAVKAAIWLIMPDEEKRKLAKSRSRRPTRA